MTRFGLLGGFASRAFEFYFDHIRDARRVNRISTFVPRTEFYPEGCVVPPQEWIELAPYSLEPPNTRAYYDDYRRAVSD